MKVAASERTRLTSSATALWSGPITTASAAPVPCGAASSTCASSDWPATGCSTFGCEDRMRVPSPAASTTVRLDRAVILFPCSSLADNGDGRRAVFNCFPLEIKPIRRPENVRIQVAGAFPVNVYAVIRRGLEEGQGRLARKPDHLADFEADDTGGVLSNLLAEEDELDRRALWRI